MIPNQPTSRILVAVLLALTLVSGAIAAPAAAQNSTNETGFIDDDGDGDIVDDVTPDFVGDLLSSLPVPDFVKEMFN